MILRQQKDHVRQLYEQMKREKDDIQRRHRYLKESYASSRSLFEAQIKQMKKENDNLQEQNAHLIQENVKLEEEKAKFMGESERSKERARRLIQAKNKVKDKLLSINEHILSLQESCNNDPATNKYRYDLAGIYLQIDECVRNSN